MDCEGVCECAVVGEEANVVVDGIDAEAMAVLSEAARFDPSSLVRPNHPNIDLQLARLDELETARLATPTPWIDPAALLP